MNKWLAGHIYQHLILIIALGMPFNAFSKGEKLDTNKKIEAHIKSKLTETINMIIKPSRYLLDVKVKTRGLNRRTENSIFLGKLGNQQQNLKGSKFIYESLVKRITKVEISLFVHPLVLKSKVEVAERLIMRSTPFVNQKKIALSSSVMNVYPDTFIISEYTDNVKFWFLKNKNALLFAVKAIGGSIIFILLSIVCFKLSRKKFFQAKKAINKRINEIKHLGLEPPEMKKQKTLRDNIQSQINLFNTRLKTTEQKALEIRQWLFDKRYGVNETLQLLPNLFDEKDFSAIYKCLSTEIQQLWQDIISSHNGGAHMEIAHHFLREMNLEGLQRKDDHRKSYALEQMTVSLNNKELAIFLKFAPQYGPFLLTSLPKEMTVKVMNLLDAETRFKVAEAGILSTNDHKLVEIKESEVKEALDNIDLETELEQVDHLQYSYLLDNMTEEQEETFFNSINNASSERLKSIFRLSIPSNFIKSKLPIRVYSIVLGKTPLEKRAKFILCLKKATRETVLEQLKDANEKTAFVVIQEIERIKNNDDLYTHIQFNKSEIRNEFNNFIKKEVRTNDLLFSIIEKDLLSWVIEKKDSLTKVKNAA